MATGAILIRALDSPRAQLSRCHRLSQHGMCYRDRTPSLGSSLEGHYEALGMTLHSNCSHKSHSLLGPLDPHRPSLACTLDHPPYSEECAYHTILGYTMLQ